MLDLLGRKSSPEAGVFRFKSRLERNRPPRTGRAKILFAGSCLSEN